MNGLHICSFTDFGDVRLDVSGQSFRFEFSHRFGPLMLSKTGKTLQTLPPKRSLFWPALQAWCDQGHRVVDGNAVYELPPEPVYVVLVGKHVVEVPPGREPQEFRREWFEKMGLPLPEDVA